MLVVGVDPGKVTGLVSFSVHDDEAFDIEHWQLDHTGTARWFEQFRVIVGASGNTLSDTIVAVETFTITPRKSPAPWSLETIGAVRYFVETAGLSLRFVSPAAHKGLISDTVLKNAGLWFPGEGHACDAARVSLYCVIVDKGLLEWALLGKKSDDGTGNS